MQRTRSRLRRAGATLLAGALAAWLLPGVASADTARVCDAAPVEVDFDDVDESGGTFGPDIACIAGYGIVQGFEDNTFRPSNDVLRGQAAAFVARTLETAQDAPLPIAQDNPYDDVADDGVFGSAILKLTEAGIVQGLTDTEFGVQDTLTRGEMAQIIAGALVELGITLDTSDAGFDDVPSDGVFAAAINGLANLGVVEGFSATEFRPSGIVTRGQLSGFTAEAAGAADDAGEWAPTNNIGPVLEAVPTSAEIGEEITVTVTLFDEDNNTRADEPVDVFAVQASEPYEQDGTPNYADGVDVDGGNELPGNDGTGGAQGQVESGDPQTDANGEVEVTVTATEPGVYRIIVWTGTPNNGTEFDVGDVPDVDRGSTIIEFSAVVAALEAESDSNSDTFRFGDDPVISVQLLDGADGDIRRAGEEIDWTVETGGPLPPAETLETGTATTNSSGVATFTIEAAEDPNTDADSTPVTYTVTAESENGTTATLDVTFDDADPNEAAEILVRHASGQRVAYSPEVASSLTSAQHTTTARVRNVYGEALANVTVTFQRDTGDGQVEQEATTDAQGIATYTFTGPGEGEVQTVTVDPADFASQDDVEPTINEVEVYFVDAAVDADTTTVLVGDTIVGVDTAADSVSVDGTLLRFAYDGDDTFVVDGTEVNRAGFEAALAEISAGNSLDVSADGADGRTFELSS